MLDKFEIEKTIDEHGLTAVIDMICEICYEKAEHIRTNYQDEKLAIEWERAAKSLVNPIPELVSQFPS